MTIESLTVPDLGGAEQVEVIEILVLAGDQVAAEESIIVLETDKATMEIPSPFDGTITSLSLKVGDKLNEGDKYGEIETAVSAPSESVKQEDIKEEAIEDSVKDTASDSKLVTAVVKSSATRIEIITVPDLGGSDQVEVIELLVNVGEDVEAEQSV